MTTAERVNRAGSVAILAACDLTLTACGGGEEGALETSVSDRDIVTFDVEKPGLQGLDSAAFVSAVDAAMTQLHANGTMKALSDRFYGKDYASAAAAFNLDEIGQDMSGASQ